MRSEPNNYLEISVHNFTEALAILLELRSHSFFIFRGQRDYRWNLGPHNIPMAWENIPVEKLIDADPKIGSRENSALVKMSEEEKKIYWRSKSVRRHLTQNIEQFMRQIQLLNDGPFEHKEKDWWHTLFFTQHYGLKTLLLDWTSNPQVALYFAVENILSRASHETRGAIFALKTLPPTHDNEVRRWFDFQEVQQYFPKGELCPNWIVINPPLNNERLIRQSGKFTYHPSILDRDLINVSSYRLSPCLHKGEVLVKLIIGDEHHNPSEEFRNELGIMNINHAFLFPGYEGFAEFINTEWRSIATFESLSKANSSYDVNSPNLSQIRDFLASSYNF
jgi:hypothetical protein